MSITNSENNPIKVDLPDRQLAEIQRKVKALQVQSNNLLLVPMLIYLVTSRIPRLLLHLKILSASADFAKYIQGMSVASNILFSIGGIISYINYQKECQLDKEQKKQKPVKQLQLLSTAIFGLITYISLAQACNNNTKVRIFNKNLLTIFYIGTLIASSLLVIPYISCQIENFKSKKKQLNNFSSVNDKTKLIWEKTLALVGAYLFSAGIVSFIIPDINIPLQKIPILSFLQFSFLSSVKFLPKLEFLLSISDVLEITAFGLAWWAFLKSSSIEKDKQKNNVAPNATEKCYKWASNAYSTCTYPLIIFFKLLATTEQPTLVTMSLSLAVVNGILSTIKHMKKTHDALEGMGPGSIVETGDITEGVSGPALP